MFLAGNLLSVDYLDKINNLPVPSEYNSLNFYGNNIIDEIHLQSVNYTDEEVESLNIDDYPAWDGNTLLLARFNQKDTQAGNILNVNSPVTKWSLYRKDEGDKVSKKIIDLDVSITEYIDYSVQAYKKYIYNLFPCNSTQIGQVVEVGEVYTDFYGWYLVDVDEEIVYKFDLDVESSEITNETDITTYQGYTKYNAYSIGNRNYLKGSLSAMCGTINSDGTLAYDDEYIDGLRAFVNNGKDKLLKNRIGNMWKVRTSNIRFKYKDEYSIQPAVVTFDYEESGEV